MAGTAKKKAAPKREAAKADYVHVTLKARREWKEWLDGLAEHCRTDVSKLIDQGMVELAKAKGYDPKPPAR